MSDSFLPIRLGDIYCENCKQFRPFKEDECPRCSRHYLDSLSPAFILVIATLIFFAICTGFILFVYGG